MGADTGSFARSLPLGDRADSSTSVGDRAGVRLGGFINLGGGSVINLGGGSVTRIEDI